jgi:hypothetical protein
MKLETTLVVAILKGLAWGAVLSLAVILLFACAKPACKDYSYVLSRIPGNAKVAACKEGMKMAIEDTGSLFNRTKMVHCTCQIPSSAK